MQKAAKGQMILAMLAHPNFLSKAVRCVPHKRDYHAIVLDVQPVVVYF